MTAARRNVALDGMRGLIVLSVIAFHAWQFTGGQSDAGQSDPYSLLVRGLSWAVAWFFVATGVLVYRSYSARVLEDRPVGPSGRFLLRRLLRVLPAYWVAVTVVWAFRNPTLPGDWLDLVEHLTLTHVLDEQRIFWTIGPAWSLPSQILLYLLLALLWAPLARWSRGRTRGARTAVLALPGVALVVVGTAYSVWLSVASGIREDAWVMWFSPLAQAPALGAGLLLGLVLARWRPQLTGAAGWSLAAVSVGLLALLVVGEASGGLSHGSVLVFRGLSAVVATAFIASVLAVRPDSGWHRVWSPRPLVLIGKISFSIYLWHEPSLLLLGRLGLIEQSDSALGVTVILTAASLLAGALAYAAIEKPLMNLTELVAPTVPFAERYRAAHAPAEREHESAGAR